MTKIKNENKAISLTVTEGLSVTILPNTDHEFLMTTKEVANGYGVSEYTIRRHKMLHPEELLDRKHFMTVVENFNGGITNCYDKNAAVSIPNGAVQNLNGKNAAVSFSHGETAAALTRIIHKENFSFSLPLFSSVG